MKHQERIEYIVDNSTGKSVYVGRSVNFNQCCQGDTIEELQRRMKMILSMHLEMGKEAIDNPLDMKEITEEEWEEEYHEWMITSKWMGIADALYDHIKGIETGRFCVPYDKAIARYEKLTTRKIVRDKLNETTNG